MSLRPFLVCLAFVVAATALYGPIAACLVELFPTRIREIEGGRAWIRDELAKLGPLSRGERPALSANKATLRRVPVKTSTDWHQDGAFLGQDIR